MNMGMDGEAETRRVGCGRGCESCSSNGEGESGQGVGDGGLMGEGGRHHRSVKLGESLSTVGEVSSMEEVVMVWFSVRSDAVGTEALLPRELDVMSPSILS